MAWVVRCYSVVQMPIIPTNNEETARSKTHSNVGLHLRDFAPLAPLVCITQHIRKAGGLMTNVCFENHGFTISEVAQPFSV